MSRLKYRRDIDGLRGFAVLVVVIFHFFPKEFHSGFIGVDIFFVISGYLISQILFRDIDSGNYSTIEFYKRRINRIFPALIVTILLCFLISWNTFYFEELKSIGKHIFGASSFSSNLILMRESGYFDRDSYTKPLLHLWSLAIEEQFYFVWPIFILFVNKIKKKLIVSVILFTTISFLISLTVTYNNKSLAFYSPVTRFWEISVGCILGYYNVYNQKIDFKNDWYLSIIGLGLICVCLVFIPDKAYFPGMWALFPVIGTSLILYADDKSFVNKYLFSTKTLVWLGLISYPLYLLHWPLIVFVRVINNEFPVIELRFALVLLSILLAWLTYQFIEKPLRFNNKRPGLLLVIMILLGVVGLGFFKEYGISKSRLANSFNKPMNKSLIFKPSNECTFLSDEQRELFQNCQIDSREEISYALVGDSKAQSLSIGLFSSSLKDHGWLFLGGNGHMGAPIPIISDEEIFKKAQKPIRVALDRIVEMQNISTVVLVASVRVLFDIKYVGDLSELKNSKREDLVYEGMSKVVKFLLKHNKRVMLVVDNPTLAEPIDCLGRTIKIPFLKYSITSKASSKCSVAINKHLDYTKKYINVLKMLKRINKEKVYIFDTIKYLCDFKNGVCPSRLMGRSLYSYSDHISVYSANIIGKAINDFLKDI